MWYRGSNRRLSRLNSEPFLQGPHLFENPQNHNMNPPGNNGNNGNNNGNNNNGNNDHNGHYGNYEEEVIGNHNGQGRTLRDYLNPTRTITPSCIILPLIAREFVVRPSLIQHLPHFHGMDNENPYLHVRDFEEIVRTMLERNEREEPKHG